MTGTSFLLLTLGLLLTAVLIEVWAMRRAPQDKQDEANFPAGAKNAKPEECWTAGNPS